MLVALAELQDTADWVSSPGRMEEPLKDIIHGGSQQDRLVRSQTIDSIQQVLFQKSVALLNIFIGNSRPVLGNTSMKKDEFTLQVLVTCFDL